jgi:AraC family transcriptional regulator, transcriptional activator of pobA
MLNTNIPYFENLNKFYEAINVPKPIHEHFDVRFIQENLKTVKMQMPPFRNPCFMISMTLKGQGSVHHAGTEAFRVGDLSVFFTAPGQLQSWDVLPDWEGIYVIFSKDFFAVNRIILEEIRESPFFDIDNRVSLTLVPEEAEVLLDLFEKIKTEANTDYPNKYEFVKSYLRLMVMYLNRFYEKRIQNNQKPNPQASGILTVREFKDLIEQNLKTDKKLKSVSEFADKLNTHPNHLNALCKEILGKTASELLHDSTLLQAKSLILNSDFSMKEIAYQLGYDEPNYFFRFFKKHIGVTPSEFKQNSIL